MEDYQYGSLTLNFNLDLSKGNNDIRAFTAQMLNICAKFYENRILYFSRNHNERILMNEQTNKQTNKPTN